MKKIIILTFLIILTLSNVFCNQQKQDKTKLNSAKSGNKDLKLFSVQKIPDNSFNSQINLYAASKKTSKKYDAKIRNMSIMAGVGGGILLLSQVFFYTGVGLYAYGLIQAENEGYSVWAADYSDADGGSNNQIIAFTGLGLMALGVVTVLAALPIFIVGLAVRMYYVNKKKYGFYLDYDLKDNKHSLALAFKL